MDKKPRSQRSPPRTGSSAGQTSAGINQNPRGFFLVGMWCDGEETFKEIIKSDGGEKLMAIIGGATMTGMEFEPPVEKAAK